jgi:hypothetical protein
LKKPLLALAVLAALVGSTARAALDAMLASDADALTAGDFAGRATWADKYRNAHRETAAWHFVEIEIDQFAAELKSPSTPSAERLLALRFLIHLVGDLHQPLHAADHHDRGGNCVSLSPPQGAQNNLHASWDVSVVSALGQSAAQIADTLDDGALAS